MNWWWRRRRAANSQQMSGNAFSFRNCSACGTGPGSAADAMALEPLQELSNVGEVRKNSELVRVGSCGLLEILPGALLPQPYPNVFRIIL